MKFYLYMSDTQAEVCQDIVNLSRKLFPCPLQIPLERTPEIPALVHFLSSSNTTGLAFFNSHIASPQAREVAICRGEVVRPLSEVEALKVKSASAADCVDSTCNSAAVSVYPHNSCKLDV